MINSRLAAIESTIRPQHLLGVASRPLLSILMLGLFLSFGAGQVRAQCGSLSAPSTTWQNGGNSFWNIDGNWTSGTPTASTNACILNGTSTVELNTNGNANGLQLATGNTLNIDSGESLNLGTGKSLIFGILLNTGGTVTNSGKLTNNGLISNSGTFSGPVVSGATFINNSGAHLTNNGSIGVISGALDNNSGAHFTNNGSIAVGGPDAFATLYNGGTFLNNSNMFLTESTLENGGKFVNSGTIVQDSLSFTNGGRFNNAGTITLFSGIDPISVINSGTFNNSGTMNVSFTVLFGNSFSNNGKLNNSGTMTVESSEAGFFGEQPATMSNSATINNTGTFNITTSSGGSFINSGTINNTGALNISQSPPNSGGSFGNSGTLRNSGTISNSGVFTNSGAVLINGGLFTTSTNYTQTAGRTIVDGTLTATGGAIVDIEGGKLGGIGTINGDVLLKGIMSPGSSGVPGTFTVNGSYEQTSTGVFDEIIKGASSNGVLDVTGVLALDPGSLLEITLRGGIDPVGDSFTILDYGSLSGEFSNGTNFFADGFEWTLTYGPNDAVLTAVSADPVNTPEPGTIPLIAIGLLALLWFAAKRTVAL
jgi:hypothetical protein